MNVAVTLFPNEVNQAIKEYLMKRNYEVLSTATFNTNNMGLISATVHVAAQKEKQVDGDDF